MHAWALTTKLIAPPPRGRFAMGLATHVRSAYAYAQPVHVWVQHQGRAHAVAYGLTVWLLVAWPALTRPCLGGGP